MAAASFRTGYAASLGIAARARALMTAGVVLVAGAWLVSSAQAQTPPVDAKTTPSTGVGTFSPKSTRAAQSKPLWVHLTAEQQAALRPLAQHWNGLSETHKRKWLALSRNYGHLSASEQATMHGRMADWARLSPGERAQARLNFAEVKRLAPADERKAKWEAYQALSEEERRRLAASATATPTTAALPIRPVPARKLAPVPDTVHDRSHGGPRIQLTPPSTRGPLLAPVPPTAEAMAPISSSPVPVIAPAPNTPASPSVLAPQ